MPSPTGARTNGGGERRSPGRRGARGGPDKEELLELDDVKSAAISLHEALRSRPYLKIPKQKGVWATYCAYMRIMKVSNAAVVGLLVLTVFEVPTWCRGEHAGVWDYSSGMDSCLSMSESGRGGPPPDELVMSGAPMLPIGVGLLIEYALLGIILARVCLAARLHSYFRRTGSQYKSNSQMIWDYVMILLGFCDAFYASFCPRAVGRIAPFVRFGLAISLPWIRHVVDSFAKVMRAIFTVSLFLVGTILIWAWIAAMVFDDLDHEGADGVPINQGLESFGKAVYTLFGTMTTALLPDVMTPSYKYSRLTLLFWMPFFILACCLFAQVILATVYNEYGGELTERMKEGHVNRMKGIKKAFQLLKAPVLKEKHGKSMEVVNYETFVQLVEQMRPCKPGIIQDKLMRICFDALDDDKSDALCHGEFQDMCTLLNTHFTITRRDSQVRRAIEGTPAGAMLEWWMLNGQEGEDFGCAPPPMATPKFPGSPFDVLMNCILASNVVWMILESAYDLNDIPEPAFFFGIDIFFSFFYCIEVTVKLMWWSWSEYWMSFDNQFDFVTTLVLASAGVALLFFDLDSSVVRYLNLFRLLRLLKALNNIPEFEQTVKTIYSMVTTCGDVLVMNVLVIYLWSAIGMELYGGRLYGSNPALKDQDLDYFTTHEEVYNFNDMILAAVTMFFVTLTSWCDTIYGACMALHPEYTASWCASGFYWLTFYFCSPLIAWNVFSAFSIDVFCKLSEMREGESKKKTEIEQNLERIQVDMLSEGFCLHIRESAMLKKEKVYTALFEDDGSSSDDENPDKKEESMDVVESMDTGGEAPDSEAKQLFSPRAD